MNSRKYGESCGCEPFHFDPVIDEFCQTNAQAIRFILLQNRQGRTRLAKYYIPMDDVEKRKQEFEIHRLVVNRDPKHTNFLEARPLENHNYSVINARRSRGANPVGKCPSRACRSPALPRRSSATTK